MTALFRLDGVHFAYPGGAPVLAGADLVLRPGERLAVTGTSGAGKSTLLALMVGLVRPNAGRVTAFGAVCRREADFRAVRRRAGLLFQDPDDQLFCPLVREDVAFGPRNLGRSRRAAATDADAALDVVGAGHLADRVPHHLSGGEKRLVALAGLLAMAPDVLLLDEPTAGLDPAAAERLLAALDGRDQAMVVASHDAGARQRLATRTLHLADGGLHAPGA